MDESIKDLIDDLFELDVREEWHFRKLYGFTFVFKRNLIEYRNSLTSCEIRPVGIIYTQNGEYYFAPFGKAEKIEKMVEAYVREAECFRSQQ